MKTVTNTGAEIEIESKSENILRVSAEYRSTANWLLNWALAVAVSWIFLKIFTGFDSIIVSTSFWEVSAQGLCVVSQTQEI